MVLTVIFLAAYSSGSWMISGSTHNVTFNGAGENVAKTYVAVLDGMTGRVRRMHLS